jgi:Tol biopolymer transport system component
MRRCTCLLVALLFIGSDTPASAQGKTPESPRQPPDGVYAVLRESLKEQDVLPLTNGEVLVVHRHRYLKTDDKQPPRYLVVRSAPDVALTLAGEPKAVKEGEEVVRILLKLQAKAAAALERLTSDQTHRPITIILGGEVVTTHKVREVVKDGQLQITSCAAGAANYLLERLQRADGKQLSRAGQIDRSPMGRCSCLECPTCAYLTPGGTIVFSSGAPRGWDVFLVDLGTKKAQRLTDHPALDYNAAFSPDGRRVAFVTQRDGNHELYAVNRDGSDLKRLTDDPTLDDHPAWSPDGKKIAFSSTRQPATTAGKAWNAIYLMNADGSEVRRVSPADASDYSPAWSPKGDWIACASGSGKSGGTDLYVMKPDGSGRKLVVKNGGWPSFSADGGSLYFHSDRQDKWGIWRVNLDGSALERITPAGVEAFTPRASADGQWLVAAVQRGKHRQIERLELATNRWTAVTQDVADHWNPSISGDGTQVLYHRSAPDFRTPNVERWGSPPGSTLRLLRVDGVFPSLSPDGQRVALVHEDPEGLYVMNIDGSSRKNIFKANTKGLFGLSWAATGDRIAFTHGHAFQTGSKLDVDIEIIAPDGRWRKALTARASDNHFPSFAPDGKRLVFRSTRDGAKNLYVMEADGTGVRRLTEGDWTDTQPNWSPTGEWIAFATNRDNGQFGIWLIKPDGTGLRKLVGPGGTAMNNHPHFSPDGQWIVFASLRAGYSAEYISRPHKGPPGDLFAIRLDGTGLLRLTHDGFGNGVPTWGPTATVRPSR